MSRHDRKRACPSKSRPAWLVDSSYARRLRVEQLEDRRMLAVFAVSNLNDAGAGSLRDAIDQANSLAGADEIAFVGAASSGTIVLMSGELEITDTLTITGPGQELLTIDAQQQSRVLHFSSLTGDLTLVGMKAQGGKTTGDNIDYSMTTYSGGGIRFNSSGTLTLTSSTVSGNSTTGDLASGGGIFSSSGTVNLTSSTVSGSSTDASAADGGGIYSLAGDISLTLSTVSNNSTEGNFASGGGIFSSTGNVSLTGSTISGNSSHGWGGGIHTSTGSVSMTGSAINGNTSYANGGGISTFSGNVSLTNSTVSSNSAAQDFHNRGGGISSHSGNVSLTSSTVIGNTSIGDGGGIYTNIGSVSLMSSTVSGNASQMWRGGGISTLSGKVSLMSSTVSYNTSLRVGGGIRTYSGSVSLTDSAVIGNSAGLSGGGIHTTSGSVVLLSSTVSSNTSVDGGGGIATSTGTVTVTSSTVSKNSARGSFLARSGGIFIRNTSVNPTLTIENSIVAGNTAAGRNSSAELWPDPESALTINYSLIGDTDLSGVTEMTGMGNILNEDPQLGALADNGGPTQTHALLPGSPALDAGMSSAMYDQRGAPFFRSFDDPSAVGSGVDIGAYERQGIANLSIVVDTLEDENDGDHSAGKFSLREAIHLAQHNAGADTITFATGLSGGEIDLVLGELSISETLIIDALGLNAPITIDAQQQSRLLNFTGTIGDLTLAGLTLKNGKTTGDNADASVATYSGGGIRFKSSGRLTLTSTTVSGSSTSGYAHGGGIFSYSGSVSLTSSTVSGNSTDGSSGDGGGIFAYSGSVSLTGSTVSGNSADGSSGDGGGIFAYSGSVSLTGSTVSGNSADGSSGDGGGIYTAFGNVSLTASTVSGNKSGHHGGGVFSRSGDVVLTSSTVSDNEADWGGGVFLNSRGGNPSFSLQDSTVAGNIALLTGPDVALDPDGDFSINHSLIGDTSSGLTTDQLQAVTDGANNLQNIDPLLGPLADNGGPTQTHALLPGSPALEGGDPSVLFDPNEFDQRGAPFHRVATGIVLGIPQMIIDIGAYEAQFAPSADFVDDDIINGADFLAWQRGYGLTVDATRADGNSDDDGDVDHSDLAAWLATYGQSESPPPPLSEFSAASPASTETGPSAELIDAVLALEWLGSAADEETEFVDEPTAIEAAVASYGFTKDRTTVTSSDAAPASPPDDFATATAPDEPWLADELLERVFG